MEPSDPGAKKSNQYMAGECVRCPGQTPYRQSACDECVKLQRQTDSTTALIYALLMNHMSPDRIDKAIIEANDRFIYLRGEFGFHNTNKRLHEQAIALRQKLGVGNGG